MITKQFEESLDDHENLLNILAGTDKLCTVHKAQTNKDEFIKLKKFEKTNGWIQTGLDLESLLDGKEELNTPYSTHKAHVPIAKFRNAFRDNDTALHCLKFW